MSKNLESEYKRIMNGQIPDLWDRIEAGIDAAEDSAAAGRTTDSAAGAGTSGSRNVRRKPWKMFAGIAAAAACVCVVVPLALSFGNAGASQSAMTAEAAFDDAAMKGSAVQEAAAAAEEAAPEAAAYEEAAPEEYALEEAAPAEEAEALEEYAAEEAALFDGSPYAEDSAGEAVYEASAEEKYAKESPAEKAAAEPAYEESNAAIGSSEAESEEAVLEILTDVRFEIYEISESDISAGRVMAKILSCPDDPSLEGQTVAIVGSETDENHLLPSKPGIYTKDLSCLPDEEGGIVFSIR